MGIGGRFKSIKPLSNERLLLLSYGIDIVTTCILFLHIICKDKIHRYQSYYYYGARLNFNEEALNIPQMQLLLNLCPSDFFDATAV